MGEFCLAGWLSATGGAPVRGMVCEHTTETYANKTGTTLESKEYEAVRRTTKEHDRIQRNTKECRGIKRNTKEYYRAFRKREES